MPAKDTSEPEYELEPEEIDARDGEPAPPPAPRTGFTGKPALDGELPASLAVDPETGVAPGHRGPGTGDGPAGG